MRDHRDDDDGELVYERGVAYLSEERVAARTVFALLRLCAIMLELGSGVGDVERYRITPIGIHLLELSRDTRTHGDTS